MKQFRGPLLLGTVLAIPLSLPIWMPVLAVWTLLIVWLSGFFALILIGLVVQIRAGVLGLRARSPALAVVGTTVAYWLVPSIVLAVGGFGDDLVPLLVSAAISGVVVIVVTTAANAFQTRRARAPELPSGALRSP